MPVKSMKPTWRDCPGLRSLQKKVAKSFGAKPQLLRIVKAGRENIHRLFPPLECKEEMRPAFLAEMKVDFLTAPERNVCVHGRCARQDFDLVLGEAVLPQKWSTGRLLAEVTIADVGIADVSHGSKTNCAAFAPAAVAAIKILHAIEAWRRAI